MKKAFFILGLLIIITLVSCGGGEKKENQSVGQLKGDFAFGGSTTVEPVALAAIEHLMEEYPDLKISYDSQGSSVGVKGVLAGTYTLGGASRELKDSEIAEGVKATAVALDGVAVIVNKSTITISNLTLDQVIAIYAGEITNWSEVGGPDAEIVVFNRDEASGTRSCFKDATVKKQKKSFVTSAAIVTSNGDMVSKIAATPYSIGYCGFGYIGRDPKAKPITVDGVQPKAENVKNNTYKIARPLNIVYTELKAGSVEKAFVDFLLSEDGQEIVKEEKFISLN